MGQRIAKIIVKIPDNEDVNVSTTSLPLTIVYEYKGKQKIYELRLAKKKKGVFLNAVDC